MNALTFHETHLEVVDHLGQPWLKAADIAQALGYAREDSVSRIYDRNKDEFTDAMSQTVNLTVSRNGGSLSNETRIFSLRGAHLIAMFAHTQRAKAFRQWVLDVLEQQAGASANVVTPVTPFPPSVLLFEGKPVLTSTRLAECFGVDRNTLRSNQALRKDSFVEGTHFVTLTGNALRDFVLANMAGGTVSRRHCRALTLWTLEGMEVHAQAFPPAVATRGREAVAAYLRGESMEERAALPAPAAQTASTNLVPALPVAELMRRKRFLMHFDARGEMVLREVPSEAMVASPHEWAQMIADPGAFFEREELSAIITAAAQRLGRR